MERFSPLRVMRAGPRPGGGVISGLFAVDVDPGGSPLGRGGLPAMVVDVEYGGLTPALAGCASSSA